MRHINLKSFDMKNPLQLSLFIGLCLLGCACHEDKNNNEYVPIVPEKPGEVVEMPEIDGKIYNAGDNFVLTSSYMGSGGSFDYDIELEEGQHASISFDGKEDGILKFYTDNFDLSSVEGNPVIGEVARPSLACFGTEISIPLKFVPDSTTGKYHFSGVQEVVGVGITVSNGLLSSEGFSAQFNECFVFDENYASGFKNEGNYYMIDFPEHDADYHYTVSPFIVSLESPAYPKEIEEIVSLSDVMQVLLNTPFLKESDYGFDRDIDREISLSTLWGRLVPSFIIPDPVRIYPLSFKICEVFGDEKLYYEAINSYPPNTFCASDVTESSYRLSIDPAKVFDVGIVKSKTDKGFEKYALNTSAFYSLMSNIFLSLTPMNAEGILMNYVNIKENDEYKFKTTFSDRIKGLAVLKSILLTIFSDSSAIENLKNTLIKEGMDAKTLSAVIYVAENLENILNNTSGATFGWSYVSQYYNSNIRKYYYDKLYEQ